MRERVSRVVQDERGQTAPTGALTAVVLQTGNERAQKGRICSDGCRNSMRCRGRGLAATRRDSGSSGIRYDRTSLVRNRPMASAPNTRM